MSEVNIVTPRSNSNRPNPTPLNVDVVNADVATWTSARYCLAYLSFFGFFNVYSLRVNLSVAIVSMVNDSAHPSHSNTSNECEINSTTHKSSDGEFSWTNTQTGLILGAFFYGYICTQIIGGYLASTYGGKYLFGGGVLCTTVLTLLTPVAARSSFGLLIALRVAEGIGEGVTFPAMHAMWGVWAPPKERAKLASMGYAGASLGIVISQPISGILCASTFLGGWPSVFYVFGTLGLVWCVLWFFLAHNSPAKHPRITERELHYIESQLPEKSDQPEKIPWFQIFTSRYVFAITVSNFCNNWGFYTLLTCLPTYLKNVLGYDISEDGFLSSLPYLVLWIMINITGHLSDTLLTKNILTVTQTRRIFNTIGLLGPAVFMICAGYTGCNNALAIVFLCLATACVACCFSGYNVNHVDIAPRYAGILMGITNTMGTVPGFVSPLVVSHITDLHPGRIGWRYIFFIAAAIYVFGAVVYGSLATGKIQPWNNNTEYQKQKNTERERLLGDGASSTYGKYD